MHKNFNCVLLSKPVIFGKENSVVFLSLSDLGISICAGSAYDDGAHLWTKKQAIFTEILQIGHVTGLLPWSISIFYVQSVCIITASKSSDYCAKSKYYWIYNYILLSHYFPKYSNINTTIGKREYTPGILEMTAIYQMYTRKIADNLLGILKIWYMSGIH